MRKWKKEDYEVLIEAAIYGLAVIVGAIFIMFLVYAYLKIAMIGG